MTAYLLDLVGLATIVCSLLVITASSPVSMVVYLIAVFVLAACYLLMLGVGFVGLSYLIVYVGAVAVLFIFVVMMLNVRLAEITTTGLAYTRGLPLGFVVGLLFLFELLSVLPAASAHAGSLGVGLFNTINGTLLGVDTGTLSGVHLTYAFQGADTAFTGGLTQVQALGYSLYGHGALWLLVTSVILLLSMVGPITLCLRPRSAS